MDDLALYNEDDSIVLSEVSSLTHYGIADIFNEVVNMMVYDQDKENEDEYNDNESS